MRLIKPSYEIIEQQPGEVGMLKHIEAQGRIAWKSEDKITDDSYIKFVNMIKGVEHGSVLEHGTVYLDILDKSYITLPLEMKYEDNPYSKVIRGNSNEHLSHCYVTTNYRVLIENNWLDDLKYQCEPTEFHEKRVTVRLVIDRGVSHEFVRHRTFSFTQESTRYCNYSKDKFGNELTFIEPLWLNKDNLIGWCNINNEYAIHQNKTESKFPNVIYEQEIEKIDEETNIKTFWSAEDWYIYSLKLSELAYVKALEQGWKAQQARAILPNSLKTELIMTGFVSDWKHFFMLRTAKGAHPQAKEIAIPLEEEFKRLGLI
jgi:thymidylate synthase (FAD)